MLPIPNTEIQPNDVFVTCCRQSVLKRILFRTNIRRNNSAEYSAETDVAKLAHYSSSEENSFSAEHSDFYRIFGHLTEYLI